MGYPNVTAWIQEDVVNGAFKYSRDKNKMPAPSLTAARKSKRVVASPTPSATPEVEMDYDEQDAEGEDEDERKSKQSFRGDLS